MASVASILETLDSSPIDLTPKQRHLLSLQSQLAETRLSLALLEAHAALTSTSTSASSTGEPTPQDIQAAEQAVLVARARHALRDRIVTQTLIADPILQIVHHDYSSSSSPGTTSTRSRTGVSTHQLHELRRAIHARDVLAMLQGAQDAQLGRARRRLVAAQRENVRVNSANAELAQRVVAVARGLQEPRVEDVVDARVRAELVAADEVVALARRRWRVVKSVTAGVVVGSGVRWADDEALVQLVLDEEDDLD